MAKQHLKAVSERLWKEVIKVDSKHCTVDNVMFTLVEVHRMIDLAHGIQHCPDYYKMKGGTRWTREASR